MRVFLCTAVALAALAAPANAAVVGGYDADGEEFSGYVRDTQGERNRLTVTASPSLTRITIRDRGAPKALRAEGPCILRAYGVASCSLDDEGLGATVDVYAGAGDDVVLVNGREVMVLNVFGGPGDDRLRHVRRYSYGLRLEGGSGQDVLIGGRGGEDLRGGPGDDVLNGEEGNDVLNGDGASGARPRGEPPGDDVLKGGPGRDVASWAERGTPVKIDLGRQIERGAQGERDALRSVESASGGRGSDSLIGNRRANRLLGRGGSDLLVGRGGADVLDAGFQGPPLFDTRVDRSRDRARDDLRCGQGRDRVSDPGLDPLPSSCERISTSSPVLDYETIPAQPERAGPRRLAFTVVCNESILHCRRRVVVSHRGIELGRSPRRLVTRGLARIVVRLRRPLPVRGLVTVRTKGADGPRGGFPYSFAYRLKRG